MGYLYKGLVNQFLVRLTAAPPPPLSSPPSLRFPSLTMAPAVEIYDRPSHFIPHPSEPMDSSLIRDAFVLNGHSFPNNPKLNLKVTANRYRWGTRTDRHGGVTLLFFHAIGCRESNSLKCYHIAKHLFRPQTKSNGNPSSTGCSTSLIHRKAETTFVKYGLLTGRIMATQPS